MLQYNSDLFHLFLIGYSTEVKVPAFDKLLNCPINLILINFRYQDKNLKLCVFHIDFMSEKWVHDNNLI